MIVSCFIYVHSIIQCCQGTPANRSQGQKKTIGSVPIGAHLGAALPPRRQLGAKRWSAARLAPRGTLTIGNRPITSGYRP